MPTDNKSEIVIFKTTDEKISVDVRFEGETVWLTQTQLVDLYGSKKSLKKIQLFGISEQLQRMENRIRQNITTSI